MGLASAGLAGRPALAHDIPNQRVDRSIQVTVQAGRLAIDYEVSLTELTLTQDLRSLVGVRPGADRAEWLGLYGRVAGPLNARGFLVTVEGVPVELSVRDYALIVEDHPRYTFHLEGGIPPQGRLSIRDTNYVSSEGTSRLALRGRGGVVIEEYDGPTDVESVLVRPIWELSDEEERRTKQVAARFRTTGKGAGLAPPEALARLGSAATAAPRSSSRPIAGVAPLASGTTGRPWPSLAGLLDGSPGLSWIALGLVAMGLGAAHAVQPGHGKTLVTAVALGPHARFYQPAFLGVATTLAHMGSVLLLAAVLWSTGSNRVGNIHRGLAQAAGFAIAAAGFWRMGRHLGGHGEHAIESPGPVETTDLGLLGLGLAGGLVPCWDAVGLVVLAAALDRMTAGVALVLAFSAGMAAVLVTVGCLAWKVKWAVIPSDRAAAWHRRLGLLGGAILAVMGLWLFVS